MPDQPTVLTRYNVTDQDPADVPARSLKVATRVRIPLGLLQISWSESSTLWFDFSLSIQLPIVRGS
jgi:hypothetical protein